MRISMLSPALGALVEDIDLAESPTSSQAEALRAALVKYHLLHVHAPDLSDVDQVRFSQIFGPVHDEQGDGLRTQYVSNVREDGIIREGALLFHSDLAFTPEPVPGLSLYAMEIPRGGSPTRFANAERAWRLLDPDLRGRLREMHARHAFDLITQRGDERYRYVDLPDDQPQAEHPIAFVNPRTREPVLYVNEMQTLRILECDLAGSDALLGELFAVLYADDNVYEHAWSPGDLLLWDNLSLQHARGVPTQEPRTLRRTTLAEKGVADQVANFSY